MERFSSLEELRAYTIETKKIFPREDAYAGGLLAYLLREILVVRVKVRKHVPKVRWSTIDGAPRAHRRGPKKVV